MHLYHSAASPFVRKVMIVLHETGQIADVSLKDVATTAIKSDPNLVRDNPLARLPTMTQDEDLTLVDSRVICRFLNDRAGADLYPIDGRKWKALVLESTADGMMDSAVAMVYENRLRPEEKQWDTMVEAHWAKVERALIHLEREWLDHLAGPLDIGHVAVAAMLGYLDFRHDVRGWRELAPGLNDWYRDISARPSMLVTAPE